MNRDRSQWNESNLEGNELTKEQLSDVYTSGTSDGIQKLADGSIKIPNEPVNASQAQEEMPEAFGSELSSPADCI